MDDQLNTAPEQEKSVKELREEAIKLGMPPADAEVFNTKAPLVATINALKAKTADIKVATLDEPVNPAEEQKIGKQWVTKASIMREKLMKQPKVRFLLPLEGAEKAGVVEWRKDKDGNDYQVALSGAIETVQLNGFKWLIPKGVFVDIPQQVAEVLSESYRLTGEAGREFLIDRIDPKTGRAVSEQL